MGPAELLRLGRIRELCDALERVAPPVPSGNPYRDGAGSPIDEAARLHELARWQWHGARLIACEKNLNRALALRESALAPAHADTLDTAERIAALHHYLSRDDAGERFEHVLERRDPDGLGYAITLRNWGAWLRDRRDPRAPDVLKQACDLLRDRAGSEHPEYVAALKAEAFATPIKEVRAISRAQRAFDVARRAFPEDHPFVAGALLTVARVAIEHGRLRDARGALAHATRGLIVGYGEEHPLHAIALWRTADLAAADDDGLEAELVLRERAWALYARTYPDSATGDGWALDIVELYLALRRFYGVAAWLDRARRACARRPQQARRCAAAADALGWTALARTLTSDPG